MIRVVDRILDRGVVNPGIDFYVRGNRIGGLDYDRAELARHALQFITLHPQSDTESVLIDDLSRLGVDIERGLTATAVGQDADAVTMRSLFAIGAGPAAGHRAPNGAIARHLDVFDLLSGYGWTVPALSRKPLEREDAHRLDDALDMLASDRVEVHLVTRLAVGRDGRAVVAANAAVFEAYGLNGQDAQAIYLVRPDGYVAWRCDGPDVDGCGAFLERFGFRRQLHG